MLNFERYFVPKSDISAGPLAGFGEGSLTLFFTIILAIIAELSPFSWGNDYLLLTPLTLILARLLVLDLRYMILPDVYTLPLTIAGLFIPHSLGIISWQESLAGAAIGFAIPFSLALIISHIKGELTGLGGGDIKIMAATGAWLGYIGLPLCIAIASMITLLFTIGKSKGQAIPFGPGLCIAFWLVFLYKNDLIDLINSLSIPM